MNKEYICVWCQHEFKQFVTYSQGASNEVTHSKGKKSSLSTQVRCPKCFNMMPTWEKRNGVKQRSSQ